MTGVLGENAKVIISTQIFFSVPIVWYSTYWSLYLVELGAGKDYPGTLASVLLFIQVVASFLSVFMAQKYGHKKTYIFTSIICWPVFLVLYALSGNVLLASAAIMINSMFMIADPSFVFLFIKGIKLNKTHSAFSILNILFTGASFFAPIAGFSVKKFGLLDGSRIIFVSGAFLMSLSLFIRAFLIEEPEGKREDTISLFKYIYAFKKFFKNKVLLRIMIVDALMVFNLTIINVYSSIYMNDKNALGLEGSLLAYFPSVYAASNILLSLIFVPYIKLKDSKKLIIFAILAGLAGWLIFVLAPVGGFWYVILAYILHGICFALYFPLIMAIILKNIKRGSETITFSLANVIALVAAIPAGVLAGRLYLFSPKLPFFLIISIFSITLLLSLFLLPHSGKREKVNPKTV